MAEIKIKCIHCGSEEVVKIGKQKNGTPRCKCKKCQKTFQTEYVNKGALPETKKMTIKMSVNGSGIRDTARVLGISKDIVEQLEKPYIKCSKKLVGRRGFMRTLLLFQVV